MTPLVRNIGFVLSLMTLLSGCGTTKFSDTTRTATEQILISSAMEDAVDEFNFYPLTGRKIFIKAEGVSATDKEYLLSILRQQLAANGVLIQDVKDEADYILEVSTGAVGTDRYELIYGTKETSVPSVLTMGMATTIPEFALIKRTDQKAKIKLTMWAYNRETGAIVWQSGQKNKTASIRDRWFFGIGPITKSSFSDKTQIGGDDVPFEVGLGERIANNEKPSVRTEATYRELDNEAIDRLAAIRKEGFEAMSFDLSDAPATATESSDAPQPNKEETAPKEDSQDAVKKQAPSPEPLASSSDPLAPSSKEVAPLPETEPLHDPPPPSTPVSAPPSFGADNLPSLQFDDLTLSIGKTVVPSK